METIRELCWLATSAYFLWLDTDGKEGCDCGALYEYCDDGDVGDEVDCMEKLERYYEWEYITREELEEWAEIGRNTYKQP